MNEQVGFQLLFERHPEPMWVADMESLAFLDVNNAAVQSYGYTREQWLAMRLPDIRPQSEVPRLLQAIATPRPGWKTTGPWKHRRSDGSLLDVVISSHVFDWQGRPALLVAARDVTESRMAAEAMRSATERLRVVVANAPIVLFAIDLAGTFTLSEGRGLESMGLGPGQVVGLSAHEVYRDDAAIQDHLRRALAGEDVDAIVLVASGPGKGREFETRYRPLRGETDAIIGVIGVATDISERRHAERERDELLGSERAARRDAERGHARMALLAEASTILASSLVAPASLSGVADLVVPRLADWCAIDVIEEAHAVRRIVLHHGEASVESRAQGLIRLYPIDQHLLDGMRLALLFGRPSCLEGGVDPRELALDPDPAHLATLRELGLGSAMVLPLVARNRILGALTLGRGSPRWPSVDVDRTLAEDLARRCAIHLDNARLYRDASEAVRVRDEFLSIASHELRSPLTSLLLQVQFLLESARDQTPGQAMSPERLASQLERAEHHIQRLSKLITNLLDVSRIAAGKLEIEREDGNLVAIARELIARLHDDLARSGCVLELDAPAPVTGRWDRVRIEQVLTNLISNSMKYGRGKPIVVSLEGDDTVARLRVKDHGIGIAAEQKERIFDRFERGVTGKAYSGLGLGLYIVRQIVSAHGGDISLESQPGDGATFTVTLPRQAPSESQ